LYSHIPTTADVDQKSHPLTHESASVGARPSSAARRTVPWEIGNGANSQRLNSHAMTCLGGAAEDGRAPTEELSCLRDVTSVRQRWGRRHCNRIWFFWRHV